MDILGCLLVSYRVKQSLRMSYVIKLLSSREIASGTKAFEFEKPAGYTFTAGQATDWTLIDPIETDAEGNGRSFSLACAPGEAVLRLATRMRDTAFKRILGKMQPGDTISIDDPWGDFTLDADESKEAVFLCGGIGVTPFLSMMKDAVLRDTSRKLSLFFSNKTVKDAPFRDELLELVGKNPALRMIETITEDPSWTGEKGFIDRAMLERHIPDITKPIYYVAGPPQMVAAMKKMLLEAGLNESQLKLDEFLGY
jgi:ferredoxin-NADP reductase